MGQAGSSRERFKWWVMSGVALGTFITTLENGMVNVSLPTMTQALRVDVVAVAWVVVAFSLGATGILLVAGRLSDLFGRREVYLYGFAVFTFGSALASTSPTIYWVIAGRVTQGVGASALMAIGPAMLSEAFGPAQRGRAFGLMSAVVSGGLLAGPLVGGFLVQLLGWRSVFYVQVPAGIVGVYICGRVLRPEQATPGLRRLNIFSAISWCAFTTSLVMLLSQAPRKGWGSGYIQGLVVALVASFTAFFFSQRRVKERLLDLALFKHSLFSLVLSASCLYYAMSIINNFVMPFYLQRVLEFSPAQVGMMTVPIFIAIMVVAPLSGRLSDRVGTYLPSIIGIILASGAVWSFTWLDATSSPADILWRQLLLGAGMGLFSTPNHSAVIGLAPQDKLGQISSLIALVRQLGFASGLAGASAMVATRLPVYQSRLGLEAGTLPFLYSLRDAWWLAALLGLTASLLYLSRVKSWNIQPMSS